MYLVLVGVLLVVLRLTETPPAAAWSWWWVLSPFALAFLWWTYSDATGLTKRREIDKIEGRKEQRRRKAFEALGLDYRGPARSAQAWRGSQQAKVNKVEGKRDAERKRHADTVTRSRLHSEVVSTQLGEHDNTQRQAAAK